MMNQGRLELIEYGSISAGMAMASSSFLIIAELVRVVPPHTIPLGIVLGGAICVVVSYAIARFARSFPSAPGMRTYLRAGYGNGFSLFMTYFMVLAIAAFVGVECKIVGALLATALGAEPLVLALAIIPLIAVINISGYELPRRLQILLAAAIFMIVGGYSAWGLLIPGLSDRAPLYQGSDLFTPDLLSSAGLSVCLFMGFEWVTSTGRSPGAYERKIPLSMLFAILSLGSLYLLLAFALFAQLPQATMLGNASPHVLLGTKLHGSVGAIAMGAVSVFAMLSTLNAGLLGISRLLYSLARQRLLPGALARVSLRDGAPIGAIFAMGVLSSAAILIQELLGLFEVSLFVASFAYSMLYASYLFAGSRRMLENRGAPQAARIQRRWHWSTWLLPLTACFFVVAGFSIFAADEALTTKAIMVAAFLLLVSAMLTTYSLRRGARKAAVTGVAAE